MSAPALALLATLLTAFSGRAVESARTQRPQLVLNIVIEGLRSDYLELLSECFGPDGFNKLMQEGVVIDNVDYGPGVDVAGAVAMLNTGTEPAVNGIATATTYNTARHLTQPTLLDPGKIGNYTDETLSPAAIRVSTLSDELRIDGAGASYSHAIAPNATEAIIMAGHAGNSAFWINDANGNWATTTHYREVPTPVTARNYKSPLSHRIDTVNWTPLLNLSDYPGLPAHKRYYPFSHTFSSNSTDKYRRFKTAAPVNREVTDLAIDYISSLNLGKRDAMDMLSVSYTLAPYIGATDTDARLETMDAYVRLDRELAKLLRCSEAAGATVVLLAGTPPAPSGEADDPKWHLSSGEFSVRKAVSLLNMYLIARHGNGDWVTGYHNGAFYLNHELIERKNINAEDLRADAAKFLMKMSGIANAYTIDDVLEGRTDEALRRNTIVATAPDVYINVIPGWALLDDYAHPESPKRTTVRCSSATAPAIIYAPTIIEPQRITADVDARRIAPTVSRILRIRSPNGAAQPPLPLVFNSKLAK